MPGDGFALGAFLFGGNVGGGTAFGAGLLLRLGFLVVVMPLFGVDAFLFAGSNGGLVPAGGGGFTMIVGPVAGVDSFLGNLVAGFGKGLALCFGQDRPALGLVGFEGAADLALASFGLGGGREGAVASTAFDFFPASFDSSRPLFAC